MSNLDMIKHPAKDEWKYRQTRQFIFDSDASAKLGKFSVEHADLVIKNHRFALLPYDHVYIEIDMREALRATGSLSDDQETRVGYWFWAVDADTMMVMTISGDAKGAEFIPFTYMRNMPDYTQNESYAKTKRELFIGQTTADNVEAVNACVGSFLDAWDFSMTYKMPEDVFRLLIAECAGGLKKAIAALLLLNQPGPAIRMTDKPFKRQIHKGKSKVFMAHSVVSIDLSPKQIRKTFQTGFRGSPRRHEVRGHFAHYNKVVGCEHDYRSVEVVGEDITPRWNCTKCGTRRVFRRTFYRGDAGIGYVKKSYEVTASNA